MGALDHKITLDLTDLDQATRDRLAKELKAQGVDLARFVKNAVTEKIARDEVLRLEVGKGFADIEAGRAHSLDDVKTAVDRIVADAKSGVAAE